MQPDEFHHFSDVTIDHSNYYGPSRSTSTRSMSGFCRRAASPKPFLLLAIAIVAALVFAASAATHRSAGAYGVPSKVCMSKHA